MAVAVCVCVAWQADQSKEVMRGQPLAAAAAAGDHYALVIGISHYQAPAKLVPPLRFAHKDAEQFADFLRSPRGGRIARPVVLTNKGAKLGDIRNAVDLAFQQAKKGDFIHLFISAHGMTAGKENYLVTHDAFTENTRDSGYPAKELQQHLIKWLQAGVQVRLYIDACRSGRFPDIPEKNQYNSSFVGVYALLASDSTSKAYEHEDSKDNGNGVFTHFLLAGLNSGPQSGADKDKQGLIGAEDLYDYVRTRVRSFTGKAQTPMEERISLQGNLPVADSKLDGVAVPRWTGTFTPVRPREFDVEPTAEKDGLTPGLLRLMDLDNQGQQLLIEYMKGDEIALPKSHFDSGARIYREAAGLNPESNILRGKQAFFEGRAMLFDKPAGAAERRAQLDRAIARLREAVQVHPEGAYAHNGLGIALLEAGDVSGAIRSFDEAIRLAPYWAYPRHNRALSLQQRGETQRAAADYERGMQLGPGYSYLAYNLGLLYQKTNQPARAEAAYREALRRRNTALPPLASAWIALGTLAAARGRGREAEQEYARAEAALAGREAGESQERLTLRHNEALLYAQFEEKKSKLTQWRNPVALWEVNAGFGFLPSVFATAEYWEKRKEWARARASYERATALAPENLAARVATIRMARLMGDLAGARRELAEVGEKWPQDPTVEAARKEIDGRAQR
jgi:tetratricopeptide (TPR) repeat protein